MENEQRLGGLSRHALLMVAACALPLALIAAVSVFRIDLGSLGSLALILLCPLMHLFMMRGMHDHRAENGCHTAGGNVQAASLPKTEERAKIPASLKQ